MSPRVRVNGEASKPRPRWHSLPWNGRAFWVQARGKGHGQALARCEGMHETDGTEGLHLLASRLSSAEGQLFSRGRSLFPPALQGVTEPTEIVPQLDSSFLRQPFE